MNSRGRQAIHAEKMVSGAESVMYGRSGEVFRAAETLAILHRELEQITPETVNVRGVPAGRDPVDEICRHNRELKKVRSFIRGTGGENEFEYLFLDNFEQMYQLAERVLIRMQDSGCTALCRESFSNGRLVTWRIQLSQSSCDGIGYGCNKF